MSNERVTRLQAVPAGTDAGPTKAEGEAEVLAYGRAVMNEEARAITTAAEALDGSFVAAVDLITSAQHVVVSGVGKAGYIASKLSATLASIGIPSSFLHPSEAIHGDLGKCRAQDVIMMLSNSGETSEILRILPHLSKRGCRLIAVTASSTSSLAKSSDVVVALGRIPEAGPLGLAPTSSTTVMLSVCDALAMCAASRRGLTPEMFAANHPGGQLGRALMLVSEIMRVGDENCIVPPDITCREVVHRMVLTKGRPGAASVADADGRLVGVFTDGDLRRWLDTGSEFLDRPVGELMSKNPHTIGPDSFAEEALGLLSRLQIDQVVVVDSEHKPIGMLDVQDIIGQRARGKSAPLIAFSRNP